MHFKQCTSRNFAPDGDLRCTSKILVTPLGAGLVTRKVTPLGVRLVTRKVTPLGVRLVTRKVTRKVTPLGVRL